MTATVAKLLDYKRFGNNPVDWAAVQQTIEKNPDEIRWVDDTYKHSVLHYSCFTNAPFDVVVFLLEKYPDAAKAKHNGGWLPLHHASCHGQSVAVVQLLVEAFPDGLNVTNNEGKTPLQLAKDQNNAEIVVYLESLTADSVKTRQAVERISAMVEQKLNTLEKVFKKTNQKTNELSTLTMELKTANESRLSALTVDLKECNKKIAVTESQVNANIENTLSALTAAIKTSNDSTLSAFTENLNTCNEKLADMEKTVNVNIKKTLSAMKTEVKTGNVNIFRALAAERKTANENVLSSQKTELKTGNENTLSAITADLNTCNKKIADMEKNVNGGLKNILSALTTDLNKDNASRLSDLTAELHTCIAKSLSSLPAETNTCNEKINDLEKVVKESIETTLTNLMTEFKTDNANALDDLKAKLQTNMNELSEMLLKFNANNKVMDVEVKATKWQCLFYFFMVQFLFSNTRTFLSPPLNTTNIAMINTLDKLDKHNANIMELIFSVFMASERRLIVFWCIGILGFIFHVQSTHFIKLYHTSMKQAFITWHKAFDFYILCLVFVKSIIPSH